MKSLPLHWIRDILPVDKKRRSTRARFWWSKRSGIIILFWIFLFPISFPLGCSSPIESELLIPVVVNRITPGLTIAEMPIKGIEIRIRGSASLIKQLPEMKLRYVIDLSNAKVGVETLVIKADQIPLPRKLSIVKIKPAFLTLRVVKEIQKKIRVEVMISGKPRSELVVTGSKVIPPSVTVKGTADILSPLKKIETQPVDVREATAAFQKEIALNLPEGVVMADPPQMVWVEIGIETKIIIQTLKNITVTGKQTPFLHHILPPKLSVKIKGPEHLLNQLKKEGGLQAYMDLAELKPGIYARRATIVLPVGVSLISIEPEIFTVKIMPKKEKSKAGTNNGRKG